jgi:protein O-GlcNAc transferase
VNNPLRFYVYVSNPVATSNSTSKDAATSENIQQLVNRGLKIKPDDVKILTNGGKNLAQKCGKYQESISYYDRALSVDSNYAPALYNKGVSVEKLGNNIEAQQLFEKARKLR